MNLASSIKSILQRRCILVSKTTLKLDKSIGRDLVKSALFLFAVLLVSNIAFINSSGWAKVFWLIVGYGGLYATYRQSGLKPADIGLATAKIKSGIKLAVPVCMVLGVILVSAYALNEDIFKDERYQQSLGSAFFALVFLLPLKTVVFEELVFRGIIPALVLNVASRKLTAALSSLVFGLWHISTSFGVTISGFSDNVSLSALVTSILVVLVTAAAGFLLLQLRWRSESLVAPLIVHWFVNASAILLASISWS